MPLRRHGGCLPAGHSASTAGETSGRPSPESSLFTQHLWRPAAKVRLRRNERVWGSALAPRQGQGSAGPGGGRGYNPAIRVSSQHQAKNLTRSSARLSGVGETSAKGTPGAGTWLQGPGSGMWHGLWASHCPGVFAAAQPLLVSRWSSRFPAAVFSSSVTQAAGILSPLCPLVPSHAAIRGHRSAAVPELCHSAGRVPVAFPLPDLRISVKSSPWLWQQST